jgi:hypothetical protein
MTSFLALTNLALVNFVLFFYHMYRGWILTRKAAKQALSGESKASITSKVQLQWTEQT